MDKILPRLSSITFLSGGFEPVVVPQHGHSCVNVWGSLWLVYTWEPTHWFTGQQSDWQTKLVEESYPATFKNHVTWVILYCDKPFLNAHKTDKGIKSPYRMVCSLCPIYLGIIKSGPYILCFVHLVIACLFFLEFLTFPSCSWCKLLWKYALLIFDAIFY